MSENDITIIGGGWSVLNLALDRLCGKIIAVNESAILAPRWDYAVSMDRLWTERRFDKLIMRSAEFTPRPEIWLRKAAVQNLKVDGWPWVRTFSNDHTAVTFSTQPETLNGTNSGACALNLAWKLRPSRVFLLGFDMCRSPEGRAYWYPDYQWTVPGGGTTNGKYAAWAKQFTAAASAFARIGCEVINVSPQSAIDTFRKMSPAQYLRECR